MLGGGGLGDKKPSLIKDWCINIVWTCVCCLRLGCYVEAWIRLDVVFHVLGDSMLLSLMVLQEGLL